MASVEKRVGSGEWVGRSGIYEVATLGHTRLTVGTICIPAFCNYGLKRGVWAGGSIRDKCVVLSNMQISLHRDAPMP
jgi:hypothetical protein